LQLTLLQRAETAETRAAAAAMLGEGIERATRLVDQLLALARSEPGAPAPREGVDLVEIARQAIAQTVSFAASRRAEIELVAPAPVPLFGDAAALGLLVRNLVDNAVRYSPPGTGVRVDVAADSEGASLIVDDAGPGIGEAERERVFDRFYRRAGQFEEGSGLGLAIVRQVALGHGGAVALATSPQGGLRVRVVFPVAKRFEGLGFAAPAPADPLSLTQS
ncbi:MAG: ATP-binding protein, partial [Pseudomonadota bacterium]|nr:ATP-binding protein [Pseudomonadota bacterium]